MFVTVCFRNVKIRSLPLGVPFARFEEMAASAPMSSLIKPDVKVSKNKFKNLDIQRDSIEKVETSIMHLKDKINHYQIDFTPKMFAPRREGEGGFSYQGSLLHQGKVRIRKFVFFIIAY